MSVFMLPLWNTIMRESFAIKAQLQLQDKRAQQQKLWAHTVTSGHVFECHEIRASIKRMRQKIFISTDLFFIDVDLKIYICITIL